MIADIVNVSFELTVIILQVLKLSVMMYFGVGNSNSFD